LRVGRIVILQRKGIDSIVFTCVIKWWTCQQNFLSALSAKFHVDNLSCWRLDCRQLHCPQNDSWQFVCRQFGCLQLGCRQKIFFFTFSWYWSGSCKNSGWTLVNCSYQ
jgi:hypothetical protein